MRRRLRRRICVGMSEWATGLHNHSHLRSGVRPAGTPPRPFAAAALPAAPPTQRCRWPLAASLLSDLPPRRRLLHRTPLPAPLLPPSGRPVHVPALLAPLPLPLSLRLTSVPRLSLPQPRQPGWRHAAGAPRRQQAIPAATRPSHERCAPPHLPQQDYTFAAPAIKLPHEAHACSAAILASWCDALNQLDHLR